MRSRAYPPLRGLPRAKQGTQEQQQPGCLSSFARRPVALRPRLATGLPFYRGEYRNISRSINIRCVDENPACGGCLEISLYAWDNVGQAGLSRQPGDCTLGATLEHVPGCGARGRSLSRLARSPDGEDARVFRGFYAPPKTDSQPNGEKPSSTDDTLHSPLRPPVPDPRCIARTPPFRRCSGIGLFKTHQHVEAFGEMVGTSVFLRREARTTPGRRNISRPVFVQDRSLLA